MSDRPETSAVRDAAALIGAAEELLDLAPDPKEAATYIGTIADAAKALRANHLADALEHVHYRAGRLADTRPSGSLLERDPSSDEEEPSSEAAARDARHEAAVDALVDPEELRARVHGDDGLRGRSLKDGELA